MGENLPTKVLFYVVFLRLYVILLHFLVDKNTISETIKHLSALTITDLCFPEYLHGFYSKIWKINFYL